MQRHVLDFLLHTYNCNVHRVNVNVESEARAAVGTEGEWSTLEEIRKNEFEVVA
jgi:hypothetical protein